MFGKITFLLLLLHLASLTFASRILPEVDVDLNNFLHCIKSSEISPKEGLLTLPPKCKTGLDKLAASWEKEKKKSIPTWYDLDPGFNPGNRNDILHRTNIPHSKSN